MVWRTSFLCPNCRQPIDGASLACPNGHKYTYVDGVLVLLEEGFGRQLQRFAESLSAMRAADNKHLLSESAYERLPFGQGQSGDAAWRAEWRLRQHDLAVVLNLLGQRERKRILDVGAWNGWLSHRLAARGHRVTAVDYFADEHDGLRAHKFYSTRWQAIQMDLRDLSVLNWSFDVVILNRCVQFFPDALAFVAGAQQRVGAGGFLVVTGLQIFREPGSKARCVEAQQRDYRQRYGAELFLFPNKGYLDGTDGHRLKMAGVVLRRYSQLWLANLKARVKGDLPDHFYGVWSP